MPPIPHRASRNRRPCRVLQVFERLESRLLLTTYNFANLATLTGGGKNGTGAAPQGLAMAPNGDLYGTAASGGAKGYGVLFKISQGTDTVIPLVNFNGSNGIYPRGGIYVDADGDVFGTTASGGTDGKGTLFEYNTTNGIQTLVNFTGPNGAFPLGGITANADGTILYGMTDGTRLAGPNKSTVFAYDISSGTLTTLAILNPNADPRGTVVADADGNVFGTTHGGGKFADGTLFEIVNGSGTITTLASFNGTDGRAPEGGLLIDLQGNLIGTAALGGANDYGTAFEWFASSSTLTLLASFKNAIGIRPHGNLTMDSDGNIFGVTALGGGHGTGAVYQLNPDGTASTLTLLYAFKGAKTGTDPSGPLVLDPTTGTLIGETFSGGTNPVNSGTSLNRGTLFELVPSTNPQTATKIVITQTPRNGPNGAALSPVLTAQVEDIFGNVVTTDNDSISVQILSGPTSSTLTGASAFAVNGIVSFPDLTIDTPGTYTLTVTDLTRSATTKPFTLFAHPI